MISAGEWAVTHPADCRITIAVLYQPVQADAQGWGSAITAEIEEWVARASRTRIPGWPRIPRSSRGGRAG